jgi:hypothetical protein
MNANTDNTPGIVKIAARCGLRLDADPNAGGAGSFWFWGSLAQCKRFAAVMGWDCERQTDTYTACHFAHGGFAAEIMTARPGFGFPAGLWAVRIPAER